MPKVRQRADGGDQPGAAAQPACISRPPRQCGPEQQATVSGNREKVEAERACLILASRDKAVLEQLAASYRAQESDYRPPRPARDGRHRCAPCASGAGRRPGWHRAGGPVMPAPLASSANAQAQTAGGAAARTPRSEASKDFSQLQGGAPTRCRRRYVTAHLGTEAADERRWKWPGAGGTQHGCGGDGNETSPLPPQTPPAGDRATDKDTPVATEDAPWRRWPGRPGPGDAGPLRSCRHCSCNSGRVALPATAGPGLPAPTPTPAPGAAIASMADSTPRRQRRRCHDPATTGDGPARQQARRPRQQRRDRDRRP